MLGPSLVGDGIDGTSLLGYRHAEVLLFYLLHPMGFSRTQCDNLVEALRSGGAGQRFTGLSVVASVVGHKIVFEQIEKIDNHQSQVEVDLRSPEAGRWVGLSRPGVPFDGSMCDGRRVVALADAVWSSERLVLRHRRRGDRLEPFGMRGSRLVSDLMAEARWLPSRRGRAWLLEADGRLLWVPGLRASRHFAVAPGSVDYCLLEWKDGGE